MTAKQLVIQCASYHVLLTDQNLTNSSLSVCMIAGNFFEQISHLDPFFCLLALHNISKLLFLLNYLDIADIYPWSLAQS